MARPVKIGLDYFPFDVDFFDDEKIAAISGEFGLKGEIATIKLLCAIYRNGYFILWSSMLQMKLVRALPGISAELLDAIIERLVAYGFFEKRLFDSTKVLTSVGIQRRFFEATKRRRNPQDYPYLLVNVNNNGVYADNNSRQTELLHTETTQSKVKQSKVNNTSPTNVVEVYDDTESSAELFQKQEFLSLDEISDFLRGDQIWLESVAMNNHVLTLDAVTSTIPDFILELRSQDLRGKDKHDARRHFANWFRKRLSIQNAQINGNTTSKKSNERRIEPSSRGGHTEYGKLERNPNRTV